MMKNVAQDCAFLVLRDIFIRHSAVLSLTAVLLHKVANILLIALIGNNQGNANMQK